VNDLAFSFDAAAQFLTLQKGGHIMVLEEVIITLLAGCSHICLQFHCYELYFCSFGELVLQLAYSSPLVASHADV